MRIMMMSNKKKLNSKDKNKVEYKKKMRSEYHDHFLERKVKRVDK